MCEGRLVSSAAVIWVVTQQWGEAFRDDPNNGAEEETKERNQR